MDDLRIGYLCDAPAALPELAQSFLLESPEYFRGQTADEVRDRILTPTLQRDAVPLALVARLGQRVAGTVALRHDSISTHPHLGPWVAALHVRPAVRGQGVGSALIQAAEREAGRLGFARLYAGTGHAAPLFERLGWTPVERLTYWNEPLVVLQRDLPTASDQPVGASGTPILVFITIAPHSDTDRAALHRGLAVLHHQDGPLSVEGTVHDDTVTLGATGDDHLDRVIDALKRAYGVNAAVSRPHIGERLHPVETRDGRVWVPVEPWMDVLVRTPSRYFDASAAAMPQHLPTLVTHDQSGGEVTLAGSFPLESVRGLRSAVNQVTRGQASVAMHFRWFRPARRDDDTGEVVAVPAVPVEPPRGPHLRAHVSTDEPLDPEV
jgi:predicted N-acetyltransferase YhbS